jgi:predicted nucleic acid-binding protein
LLYAHLACTHTFVIGELACGNLGNRAEILGLLRGLPNLSAVTDDEVLFMIEKHRLMGRGTSYIDAHLIAAFTINSVCIWAKNKHLKEIAAELGLAHRPSLP